MMQPKRKILFCGASGYRNMGDDGYRAVFEKYLGKKNHLMFTSPYPDMSLVDWADVVVIGGGGLIYCNKTAHFDYMKMYMDRAIEQEKPLYFISCGVQIKTFSHDWSVHRIIEQGAKEVELWKPYLEAAEYISVRSLVCQWIINKVAPKAEVAWRQDLCYLLEPADYSLIIPGSQVIIPTPSTKKSFPREVISDHSPVYFVQFSRDDRETVLQLASEYYRGTGIPYDTRVIENLTPREAMAVVRDAGHVMTGRYHGMVFAVAMGTPFDSVDGRYKSVVEHLFKVSEEEILEQLSAFL